ncbi:MAG: hypothetical protein EOP86_15405 [Verrucomicrobiaceae bacterium]|nr:MAG: hypothetical protein EOP86_15405 [Verrucomicrobiaceae bacterium]
MTWSQGLPFATATWLSTLPLSPERDRAVAIFARIHAANDPERSAAWAESITDPGQRGAALSAVSLSAGKRDPSGDSNRNGAAAAVRP